VKLECASRFVIKIFIQSVTLNGEVMNAAGFDTGYGIWRLEQKDFELLLAKSIVQKRHKNKFLKNTPEITDNFWENLSMSFSLNVVTFDRLLIQKMDARIKTFRLMKIHQYWK